jgi:phosphoglucosamine mutase
VRFGTDGVRGLANAELTPELALALGRAAAHVLGAGAGPGRAFVVGRDTRRSGPLLESAFVAGLASAGADPLLLGVAPTPAVAWVSADADVPGAVVSASHNPFPDNGIKLFAAGGRKLAPELEAAVEGELAALLAGGDDPSTRPSGADVGWPVALTDHVDAWAAAVAGTVHGRLDGMRIVIDCANGAASVVGPDILESLGAEVHALHARPDGTNINAGCGATHTGDLRRAVVDLGADLGLALDGDADRCIAVDAAGDEVDGDRILAVLAVDRLERRALPGSTVVVTVMTNLGFRIAMAERGIHVVDTAVGDRHVLDALEAGGWALGGEQSGHVIQRDLATTGDGMLTGVQLCDVVVRTGRPLAELAAVVTPLPQVLRNVRLPRRGIDVVALVADDVAAAQRRLGEHGRVLLRPSGTEPVVRVMVEAASDAEAAAVADGLVAAVEHAVR